MQAALRDVDASYMALQLGMLNPLHLRAMS